MRALALLLVLLVGPVNAARCPVRVASVEAGFEGERAGLKMDDCLLRWRRGNGRAHALRDPLDLLRLELEWLPRGDVEVELRRADETRWVAFPTGLLGVTAWPALPAALRRDVEGWRDGLASGAAPTALPAGSALQSLPPRERAALHFLADRLLELRSIELQGAALEAAIAALDPRQHPLAHASLLQRRCRLHALGATLDTAQASCAAAERAEAGPGFRMTRLRLAAARLDLLRRQGLLDQAETAALQLLDALEALVPDSLAAVEVRFQLASILQQRGSLPQALQWIESAQSRLERIGSAPYFESIVVGQRGLIAKAAGDFDAAERALARAVDLRESFAPDSLDLARALNNHALVALDRGDLVAAESEAQRALDIKRRRGTAPRDLAATLAQLAQISLARERLDEAAGRAAEALAAQREAALDSLELANRLMLAARIAIRREQPAQAREWLDEAQAIIARNAPDSGQAALPLLYRAELELARGDAPAAAEFAGQAAQRQRSAGLQARDLPFSLQVLGDAETARGRHAPARAAYAEAVALRERNVPDSLELAHSLAGLGRAERALGLAAQARQHLCEAAAVVDRQRWRWSPERSDQFELSRRTAAIFRDCAAAELDGGDPRAAFDSLEHGRARVLLESMALRRVELLDTLPDALRATLRAAERDPAARAGALAALETRAPALAAALLAPPTGFAQLHATLDRQSAALGWTRFNDGRVYLLLVRAEDAQPTFLRAGADAADLDALVARLQALAADPQSPPADIERLGRRLHAALVAPAEPLLRGHERLMLVPDEHLAMLPFALLRDARGRLLLERHRLRQAASFSSALLAAKRAAAPGRRVLLLAEPRGSRLPSSAGAQRGGALELPALPGVRREIAAIAQQYGAQAEPAIGAAATRDHLYAALPGARILHVAAHGLLDPVSPLDSALVLAPATSGDSGLWTAFDMLAGPPIGAELVSLSACSVGSGRVLDGEGLVGVRHALRAAGAREVLSALWAVSDGAGAALMTAFHRELQAGAGADEALRRAQLALLASRGAQGGPERGVGGLARTGSPHAHPYFWAGFVLDGAW